MRWPRSPVKKSAFGRSPARAARKRSSGGEVQQQLACLARQMLRNLEERLFRRGAHIVHPLHRHAMAEEHPVRHLGEQPFRRLRLRCRFDVLRDDDFPHRLTHFDQLRRASLRMPLDLASLGPGVRRVVMIDVAEHQARCRLVDDQPQIAADTNGPEVRILRLAQPMELHPRAGRIHLQIKRRRLRKLLLLAGEPREAVGEGVGDSKVHRWCAAIVHQLKNSHLTNPPNPPPIETLRPRNAGEKVPQADEGDFSIQWTSPHRGSVDAPCQSHHQG